MWRVSASREQIRAQIRAQIREPCALSAMMWRASKFVAARARERV